MNLVTSIALAMKFSTLAAAREYKLEHKLKDLYPSMHAVMLGNGEFALITRDGQFVGKLR